MVQRAGSNSVGVQRAWMKPAPQRRVSALPCLLLLLLATALQTLAQADGSAASAGPQDAVGRLLQSGATEMHMGHAAQAEGYFRQAVVAAPTLADGYLGLGMSELREGKAGDAEEALAKAVALNPGIRGGEMFLGIAQYQSGKLDAAKASLESEVKAQPDNVEALTWLGIVELGAGEADKAVGPLDRAAALSPKDANVLDYRGRAHSLVAQESYRALTALDPDSWRVHRALGEIAAESRQWQEAADEYRKAIAKQPQNPDLYEVLGDTLQRLSHFEEATKAYEAELKLSPRNGIALFNLGRIQVLSGDSERGVAYLRQAVESRASPAPADYYLGFGLAQTGHPEEAAAWLEKSLTQGPTEGVRQAAYFQLVQVYRALHRSEDAERAAEELKKLKAASGASGAAPAP